MSSGKTNKKLFQNKNFISTLRPLKYLHIDLLGPSRTSNLIGNFYVYVIVNDFSKFI